MVGRARSRVAVAVAVLVTAGAVGTQAPPIASAAARVAAAAAAAPAAAPVAAASVTAAPVQRISWSPCRDGFECARVNTPLDHDQPDGVQVALSVVRLPAADPARRVGSLLVNPGGPGGSGVDFVRDAGKFFPLELRRSFDLVGFDPRGILRSSPLRCFATFDEALGSLPDFEFPLTAREERQQRTSDQRLARACARRGGPVLAHMSTSDVARDMDLLRTALGDSRLTYLGYSYGSVLGQVYANLFPDRVRALVLDGVLDPIAWTTGRGNEARTTPFNVREHSDQGASRTLGEFFRLCDAAGQDCAFSGDARGRYSTLTTRLRRSPLETGPDGEPETLTYADVVSATLGAMFDPSTWPDLAEFLAEVERAQSPSAINGRLARLRAGLGLSRAAQEPYPNVVEGSPGVFCSDSVNPRSFGTWRAAAHEAARRYRYFGRAWGWVGSVCAPWTSAAGQDRYLGPWTARTSSPVLLVGNYFDPATRYQGAVTVSRLLPGASLLSYAGWGHTAYLGRGNFCVDDKVTQYLVTTLTPAPGTVCPPEGSPFGPTEASAAARSAASVAAALDRVVLPPVVRSGLQRGPGR
jgi:pimeloyl-ACP methyl ester carboxylesterase